MPWVRIHDGALRNLKIVGLSDGAFRLWVAGLAHAQEHLTDGAIRREHLKLLAAKATPKAITELTAAAMPGSAPLWSVTDAGFEIHDFLQWNDSRDRILAERLWKKRRQELYSDMPLLAAVRARDGNHCRYCDKTVMWTNRRGPDGGTYDHIIPRGDHSLNNIVVACRGCNSTKRDRTPEQAGMRLLKVKSEVNLESISSRRITDPTTTTTTTTTPLESGKEGDDGADAPAPARLLETWNQHRGPLPEAHLTPDRRRASAARLKETPDLVWWASAVDRMAASAFCRGETGRPGWRADYDFLVKPGIAVKVHEGKYDGGLPCCEPTAQELAVAKEVRRQAFGRCPHEPKCASTSECVRAIAVERKAKSA